MTTILTNGAILHLLNMALQATLAAGLGWGLARLLRQKPAPMRCGVLLTALFFVAASPGTAWVAGRIGIGFLCVGASPAAPAIKPGAPLPPALDATTSARPNVPAPVAPLPGPAGLPERSMPKPIEWTPILIVSALTVWAVGAAAGLFLLARGTLLLRRLVRDLRPPQDRRLPEAAVVAAQRLGLRQPPEVGITTRLPAPMSLGILRPRIVFPFALAQTLDDHELRGIVLHETAHIAHRDHLVGLVQRLVEALFWWNPLIWRLSDALAETREEICDNYVVQAQGSGESLARCLLDVAERIVAMQRLPAAIGLLQPRRGFEERVKGLLRKDRNTMTRMNRTSMSLAAVFAVTIGAAMLVSCVSTRGDSSNGAANVCLPAERAKVMLSNLRVGMTEPEVVHALELEGTCMRVSSATSRVLIYPLPSGARAPGTNAPAMPDLWLVFTVDSRSKEPRLAQWKMEDALGVAASRDANVSWNATTGRPAATNGPQVEVVARFIETSGSNLFACMSFQDDSADARQNGLMDAPSSGAHGEPLTLTSILDGGSLSSDLRSLAKEGNTDLLSAPKLTTRSGTPSAMKIISEYTYPTDVKMMTIVTTNGSEVVKSLAAMPCKFEVREVGVMLDVTPTLDKNTGMIGLQLTAAVVNEPKWMDSTITRLGPDGADHEAVISLPFFAARSINTFLSMKDGETVLITGSRCKIKSVRQVEDRVPVVGSIPILGRAFCSSTTVEEERWLLVAVTARRVD